jgi:sulfite reductase alpha subunit-like flavoprotein
MSTSSENPFLAPILSASKLTKTSIRHDHEDWDESRNVISVTVSIKGSDIVYSPGDSIGIYPQNSIEDVQEILDLLRVAHSDITSLNENTIIRCSCIPPGFARPHEDIISIGELLSFR